jgi:hypothetical protein
MFVWMFLLCLILTAPIANGQDMNVYLYDEEVTNDDVDVSQYLATGEVHMRGGHGYWHKVTPGPAPDPYPHVHMWEPGIERLGSSSAEIDGIYFLNVGQYWMAKQWALVVWKIQIPQASLRQANEFTEDLTLSLWIDWNQDEQWGKNEKLFAKHINLSSHFPTNCHTMYAYYLTKFRVPDIDDYLSQDCFGNKDLRKLWIRGTLSYDDPDVSPDGEQLFGEVEDYQITYMVNKKKKKEH